MRNYVVKFSRQHKQPHQAVNNRDNTWTVAKYSNIQLLKLIFDIGGISVSLKSGMYAFDIFNVNHKNVRYFPDVIKYIF